MKRVALLAAAGLLWCGCHGSTSAPGGPLVAGDPGSPATGALPDVAPVRAAAGDLGPRGVLLTRLTVVLRSDATVGQLDSAAQAIGATGLAFARRGSPMLTLAVPRQASGKELQELADTLRAQPGILLAAPGRQLATEELPQRDGMPVPLGELDYLLASRFPAAWNARAPAQQGCTTRPVTVVVPDDFLGTPPPSFASQLPGVLDILGVPLQPLAPATPDLHGYQVMATLAARFDDVVPTGAVPFPECLKLVPVDLGGLDMFGSISAIVSAVAAEGSPAVLSASVGYHIDLCGTDHAQPCAATDLDASTVVRLKDAIALRVAGGIEWARAGMAPGVVNGVLLAVAAGNEGPGSGAGVLGQLYPGLRSAALASPFGMATRLDTLRTMLPDPTLWAPDSVPSLVLDTAFVDALVQDVTTEVAQAPSDLNLTLVGATTSAAARNGVTVLPISNDGADLFAVGQAVSGLDNAVNRGTSFSAPQVAGLAAYLWLLDDGLRSEPVEKTLALLRATAFPTPVAGLVDAYGAVAATDARSRTLKIRKALVDVTGDGVFDHLDLQKFVQAYGLDDPSTPDVPAAADYGRFDLNGDGLTGGIPIAAFDLDAGPLDASGAPGLGEVSTVVEGYPVDMSEAALSDLQVLCYYAYVEDPAHPGTPLLYDARPEALTERTNFLGAERCAGVRMDAKLPAALAGTGSLSITMLASRNGKLEPAPGVLLALTPTCATLDSSTGRTDSAGAFTASITPSAGCKQVSVHVVASGDPGKPVLAEKTVTAAVGGSCIVPDPTAYSKEATIGVHKQSMSFEVDGKPEDIDESLSPGNGTASAHVAVGSITVDVDDPDTNKDVSDNVTGVVVISSSNDSVVVQPNDPTLLGKPGTFSVSVKVDASIDVGGDSGAARWSMSFRDISASGTTSTTGGSSGDPSGNTYSTVVGVLFGSPLVMDLSLSASAGLTGTPMAPFTGSAHAHATATISGITDVRDEQGNPVSVTLCSASGRSW